MAVLDVSLGQRGLQPPGVRHAYSLPLLRAAGARHQHADAGLAQTLEKPIGREAVNADGGDRPHARILGG